MLIHYLILLVFFSLFLINITERHKGKVKEYLTWNQEKRIFVPVYLFFFLMCYSLLQKQSNINDTILLGGKMHIRITLLLSVSFWGKILNVCICVVPLKCSQGHIFRLTPCFLFPAIKLKSEHKMSLLAKCSNLRINSLTLL